MNKPLAFCLAILAFTNPGLTQPAPSEDQSRTLQAGDQLEINISTLPEQEKKYQIRADGTFYHPYAGEILASGKTLAQLQTILKQRFAKQLRNPSFHLGLVTQAEADAALLGEVRSQGKFKFVPGSSIMDLIAQAGGLTEKADLDGATILRAGKQIPINLSPSGQAELARMPAMKGDIIYINRGKRVGVSGEVQAKGIYAVSSRSLNPVEDAIKAAGGATENGALNRVQIIRPSLSKPLEVDLQNKEAAATVLLEDGDTVLLPARRVVVLGAVNKPGTMPLASGESLMSVVSQAGPTKARTDSIVVVRADQVLKGGDKKEVYNLDTSFEEGKAVPVVPINDGDLIYVPPQAESALFDSPTSFLYLLTMARSLISF